MVSNHTETDRPKFATIQGLRFVAALMVVFTHGTFYLASRTQGELSVWDTGAQGVHLFFVVSGFVMAWTARPLLGRHGAFRYFLMSRLIRIAPLYWALNILKIIQVALVPAIAFVKPDWLNVVLSMLFIPSRNTAGAMETFYGVGWTLNFEMFFYLVFALCLLYRIRTLLGVTIAMLIASALGIIRQPSWPAISFLFHPIVLNFVWGLLIAEMYAARRLLPDFVAGVCIVVGLAVVFAYPAPTMKYAGLQYAMIVAGLVSLEDKIGPLIPRWVIFGGDASYSLYLVHPVVGVVVAIAIGKLHVGSVVAGLGAIVMASFVAAACVYVWFERPVTRFLKSKLRVTIGDPILPTGGTGLRAPAR